MRIWLVLALAAVVGCGSEERSFIINAPPPDTVYVPPDTVIVPGPPCDTLPPPVPGFCPPCYEWKHGRCKKIRGCDD